MLEIKDVFDKIKINDKKKRHLKTFLFLESGDSSKSDLSIEIVLI